MVISRRSVVATLTAAGAVGAISGLARAQGFKARQYHPQPVTSHLHIYLTKLWDAVRAETDGRLDVTVYAQNNGVPIADPDILKLIQSGELEFFVLNGNILSQAHPVADIQGIPFAFTTSEQVTSLTDGELGALMRRELAGAGVYLIPYGGMENGFKHITSVAKPIRDAADLEGFRMRTPGGKLFVEFYRALGAEPKIIGFNKLYQALAEGQVDGQENPLVIAEEALRGLQVSQPDEPPVGRVQHDRQQRLLAASAGRYPGQRRPQRKNLRGPTTQLRPRRKCESGENASRSGHDRQYGRHRQLPQTADRQSFLQRLAPVDRRKSLGADGGRGRQGRLTGVRRSGCLPRIADKDLLAMSISGFDPKRPSADEVASCQNEVPPPLTDTRQFSILDGDPGSLGSDAI
jgi:hypothetical protein